MSPRNFLDKSGDCEGWNSGIWQWSGKSARTFRSSLLSSSSEDKMDATLLKHWQQSNTLHGAAFQETEILTAESNLNDLHNH
jgi:hypothetical protein